MSRWTYSNTASIGSAAVLAVLLTAGCGQQADSPATTAAAPQAEDAGGDSFGICRMLSTAQVASVLPDSDDGMVASDGGSLIEGVDSYQCSYTAIHGTDLGLLTVIVTVAPNDELFEKIRVTGFAFDDDDAVAVGDSAWKKDDSADEFEVVANKGRSVLRLGLMSADARSKADQMLDLARVVAGKL
ncbi:MAG: hypothetical protein FJ191_13595 [Gammaproteobacteria bacterium]|nr:hypothetical protein [Gammaproteobacteria bacterium]